MGHWIESSPWGWTELYLYIPFYVFSIYWVIVGCVLARQYQITISLIWLFYGTAIFAICLVVFRHYNFLWLSTPVVAGTIVS